MNQQPQPIQVKASDEALKGFYSTHMQVAHSKEEFILDFMNLFPPQAVLGSRVIMNPAHAKRMSRALEDNIKKYEATFGNIEAGTENPKEIGFKV